MIPNYFTEQSVFQTVSQLYSYSFQIVFTLFTELYYNEV